MDYVINHVWTRQRPLRFESIFSSGIELHCTATDADRASIVDLTELRTQEDIRCALRASGRLPWLAGGPVSFRGMNCSTPPWPRRFRSTAPARARPTCSCFRPGPRREPRSALAGGRAVDGSLPAHDQPGPGRAARDALAALRRAHRRARRAGGRSRSHPAVCVIRPARARWSWGKWRIEHRCCKPPPVTAFRSTWMALRR